jgi:hypothetical protein
MIEGGLPEETDEASPDERGRGQRTGEICAGKSDVSAKVSMSYSITDMADRDCVSIHM